MQSKIREQWQSQMGFLLSSIGISRWIGCFMETALRCGSKRGWGIYPLVYAVHLFVSIPLFIAELVLVEQAKRHCGHFYTAVCTKFVLEFCRLAQCNDRLAGVQLVLCGSGWGLHYILMALVDAFAGKSAQQVGELFELFRSSGQLNVLFRCLFFSRNRVGGFAWHFSGNRAIQPMDGNHISLWCCWVVYLQLHPKGIW